MPKWNPAYGEQHAACRSMACCVPGCETPRERVCGHHVRTVGAGGLDADTAPLCFFHHHQVHQVGRWTFQAMHHIDLRAVADRIARARAGDEEACDF